MGMRRITKGTGRDRRGPWIKAKRFGMQLDEIFETRRRLCEVEAQVQELKLRITLQD